MTQTAIKFKFKDLTLLQHVSVQFSISGSKVNFLKSFSCLHLISISERNILLWNKKELNFRHYYLLLCITKKSFPFASEKAIIGICECVFVRFFMLPTIIRICSGKKIVKWKFTFLSFRRISSVRKSFFPIQSKKFLSSSRGNPPPLLCLYQKKKEKRKRVGNKWKSEILYIMFNFRFVNLVASTREIKLTGKARLWQRRRRKAKW
jgi:hypothetical protein